MADIFWHIYRITIYHGDGHDPRIFIGSKRRRGGLRFGDFAAAQAGGADADPSGSGAHLGVHRSQVHIPTPFGDVVGVADIISELRPLAADLTYLCHSLLQVSSELDTRRVILTESPSLDQSLCGVGGVGGVECPPLTLLYPR